MSDPNNSNENPNDNVLGCPKPLYDTGDIETDEKRPADGQDIYHIYLGVVEESDFRTRVLSGLYVIRDEGHTRRGKPSPCWVWKGAMRSGKPILRTWLSSYSPRSRLLQRMGIKGRAIMDCDTPGCIRPHHMTLQTPKDVMAHARKHQDPPARDPKTGQFLPA